MMKKTVDLPLFYDILRGLKALCAMYCLTRIPAAVIATLLCLEVVVVVPYHTHTICLGSFPNDDLPALYITD